MEVKLLKPAPVSTLSWRLRVPLETASDPVDRADKAANTPVVDKMPTVNRTSPGHRHTTRSAVAPAGVHTVAHAGPPVFP